MRDDNGIAQLFTISPNGGAMRQITRDAWGMASAFSWDKGGKRIAYVADNSIFVVDVESGQSVRVTPRSDDDSAPLSLACVLAPDGKRVAYLRRVLGQDDARWNQIFVAKLPR